MSELVRPRIILHIGRNKAGSTTIQDFCLRERAGLQAHGVSYVLFGHLSRSRADTPGFETFEELREHARSHPDDVQLVSNEFMFGWPDAFTVAAARVLRDCRVSVVAYVRSYADWIVSAYAEETRKGMNLRDIDAYVAWMWPRITAWPYLATWGEAFGWGALRVRDLSARSLVGGDLICDFKAALGLPHLRGAAAPSNRSPHWLELELARRLTRCNGEVEWSGVAHAELEPLLEQLRPLLHGAPDTVYLTSATRRRLGELYASDLARIAAASGDPPPDVVEDGCSPERSQPPSLKDAPQELLAAFFARTREPGFMEANPQAAARAHGLAAEMGIPSS